MGAHQSGADRSEWKINLISLFTKDWEMHYRGKWFLSCLLKLGMLIKAEACQQFEYPDGWLASLLGC